MAAKRVQGACKKHKYCAFLQPVHHYPVLMKLFSLLPLLQSFLHRNGLFIRPSRPRFEIAQGYIRITRPAGQLMGVKRSKDAAFEVSLLSASASYQR